MLGAAAQMFEYHRNETRFLQFLRGSLLNLSPLPTVDAALAEFITEDTRLASLVPAYLGSMDSVLAAARTLLPRNRGPPSTLRHSVFSSLQLL